MYMYLAFSSLKEDKLYMTFDIKNLYEDVDIFIKHLAVHQKVSGAGLIIVK